MHKGVYIGKNAENISERILIIGESHHSASSDEDYTTESVVKDYFVTQNISYRFFHRIACSFGVDVNSKEREFALFWDNVYFGNYINEYCGVQTSQAEDFIKKNRVQYNNELFTFINENRIKKVFVFSRLVYNRSLPSFSKANREEENLSDIDEGNLFVNNKRDYIKFCKYLPHTEHKYTNIILSNEVTFYGLRHPSAWGGYSAENYSDYLKKELF